MGHSQKKKKKNIQETPGKNFRNKNSFFSNFILFLIIYFLNEVFYLVIFTWYVWKADAGKSEVLNSFNFFANLCINKIRVFGR